MIEAHIPLSIALFFATNWIGQHSLHVGYIQLSILAKVDEAPAFNFLYRVFSPVAFITVCSAILYRLGADFVVQDIYMVTVYYFLFRISFNIITGKFRLLNWITQFLHVAVSVSVSYYVYDRLLLHKEFLFPSTQDVGTAVWLGVAAYIYHTANNVRLSGKSSVERKRLYLKHRYEMYSCLYGQIIKDLVETKKQEILVMSILIYEAFNRPKIYRAIENFLFRLKLAKTLGIMQVTTDVAISDEDSVRIGTKRIFTAHQESLLSLEEKNDFPFSWVIRRKVVASYNRDNSYVEEVVEIYEQLVKLIAPELEDDRDAEWARYQEFMAAQKALSADGGASSGTAV